MGVEWLLLGKCWGLRKVLSFPRLTGSNKVIYKVISTHYVIVGAPGLEQMRQRRSARL